MKTIADDIREFLDTDKPWRDPRYVSDWNQRSQLERVVAAKRLRTIAISNTGHQYECFLFMVNLPSGFSEQSKKLDDDTFRNHNTMKWTLRIGDTPGAWYMTTLMEDGGRYPTGIAIDSGQNWWITNFQEVLDEARKLI